MTPEQARAFLALIQTHTQVTTYSSGQNGEGGYAYDPNGQPEKPYHTWQRDPYGGEGPPPTYYDEQGFLAYLETQPESQLRYVQQYLNR